MYNNPTYIPSDYTGRFQFDGNGNNDLLGGGIATITNGVFEASNVGYKGERLLWGATTTCTYASITFTNSYIFIDGVFIKNSGQVTSTAINGVNGSTYELLTFFNRTLTSHEELALKLEGLRRLGPTQSIGNNGDFQKYSTPNLEKGKILEISRATNGAGLYINQTGNGNNGTPTNVTDIVNGLNNEMGFNGISSKINLGSSLTIADVKSFACTLEKDTVDNKFILDLGVTGNANNYSWGVIKFNLDTIYIYYMTHLGGIGNGVSFPFDITNKPTRIGLQFSGIREYNNSNGFKCFVNGVEQVTTSIADHNYTYSAVSGDSHIGVFKRNTVADNSYYNGGIINPELYNRNLTNEEWQQDFYKNYIT